ncbi:unnamed protein product [Albugo candida]|uniref:Uncharacterized protein n=1 Tax=Albugo candida TaxID=65357 RepID=A0A024FT63_9STRA|nr:unnamed protein product [Albugo candida]|eukprot:CCI10278.1 unnamed protein product [Albugo candida]
MEWLSDRTVFEHMKAFLPFFLPLSENEQKLILRQLPRSTQKIICRPGMINFLPYGVQKALLPDLNEELLRVEYPLYKVQKCRELLTNAQVDLPAKSEMQVGFDMYKASALKLVRQGSAPPRQLDDVLYRILAGRLSRLTFALIPFARKQSLSKIASLSGTLLMLQLYFFPKTRHLVKSSLQLTSAMTLGSAVLFAIGMQSAPKCKSLYFLLSTFMRSFGRNRGYFLQKHGAENEVLWNKKVTSSVSLVLVIMYMVKKLRI